MKYTYDMAGRMLTRDDGVDVTTSTWDGFDCIREQTGISTTTYCIPEGVLTSFIRDGDRYDCHADALLSIRMITDENGDVVLRRDFDAWGGELPGNFDNVPDGMPYGFVGSLGCRQDPASGLVYMRQRWYDPQLQRFISRDPIGLTGGVNLYSYVENNPAKDTDPAGELGSGTANGFKIPKGPKPNPVPVPVPVPLPTATPPDPPCSCFARCMEDQVWEFMLPGGIMMFCGAAITKWVVTRLSLAAMGISLGAGVALLIAYASAHCNDICQYPEIREKYCPHVKDSVEDLNDRFDSE